MKCKGEYNILYTVSYFNPIGNCDWWSELEFDKFYLMNNLSFENLERLYSEIKS